MTNPKQHEILIGPWPVPGNTRSILLFGGTFDPPHRAHIELPQKARSALDMDWLVYIPAARSPFKQHRPLASDQDRLDMLAAALAPYERVSISTLELSRSPDQPSYTVDTLKEIQRLADPDCTLRLLIGEDQARDFHNWKSSDQIIQLAEPVVLMRDKDCASRESFELEMRQHWSRGQSQQWRTRALDLPLMDVSATRIRHLLAHKENDQTELKSALCQVVLDIIQERKLYQ